MHLHRKLLVFLYFINLQILCIIGKARMKLDPPEFSQLLTPELRVLIAIFEKYGFKNEIRIVGGAVRDLLIGANPADLDLATTVTPQEMKRMFTAEGVHFFSFTGEKHGTVIVRINRTKTFEITTLHTAGQFETLQLTKDWFVDATRRDLTINAMYLDLEGNLYDYYNGYEDLKNNRVIFTNDADKRIKEDHGAILRYFRFFGKFTKDPHNHDKGALRAIRDNVSGLDRIPGERIWSELRRILTGNFVNEIVKTMLHLGLSQYLGLSHLDDLDISYFDVVCKNSKKYSFEAITFVASLVRTKEENEIRLATFEARKEFLLYRGRLGRKV